MMLDRQPERVAHPRPIGIRQVEGALLQRLIERPEPPDDRDDRLAKHLCASSLIKFKQRDCKTAFREHVEAPLACFEARASSGLRHPIECKRAPLMPLEEVHSPDRTIYRVAVARIAHPRLQIHPGISKYIDTCKPGQQLSSLCPLAKMGDQITKKVHRLRPAALDHVAASKKLLELA